MGGAAEGSQLTRQLSSKASSISNSHPTSSSVPHASISRLNLDFTTSSTQLQPKPKPQPEPSNGGVGNPRLSRLKAPPVPSSNNPPVSPVSPAYALKHHAGDLSPYEQSEILDYQKIYFTGPNANKAELCGESNHGFDDERGDYINVMHDHLCFRFQIMSIVGKGSFGQVT
jgi:dual specificity tyrosine-phosphorylation-regulated kinase 2/3/4